MGDWKGSRGRGATHIIYRSVRGLCLLALAGVALIGCGTYDDEPRETLSLAGDWRTPLGLVALPGTTDESAVGDTLSDLLNAHGRLARRHYFVGPLDYVAQVELPASMEERHIQLLIERARPTTLWVDGDSVGSRESLHTPHIYDLTPLHLEAGTHTFRLRIDNGSGAIPQAIGGSHAVSESTQGNWNGAIGSLRLEAMPLTHIESVRALATYDSARVDNPLGATAHGRVRVRARVSAATSEEATLSATLSPRGALVTSSARETVALTPGLNEIDVELDAFEVGLWSEWQRQLYDVNVRLETAHGVDQTTTTVGFRRFEARAGHLAINGQTTFLRGKHDACVFPLTAHPPMDVESWRALFSTAQQWGVNHYRFHSWTPPEAAFAAADELGLYLQPELPYWGELHSDSLYHYLLREGERIVRAYGSHPSFVLFGLGNELGGDTAVMRRAIERLRALHPLCLYAAGSNNFLGWRGSMPFEDVFVTCRVGPDGEHKYDANARASFSFCDADEAGVLNALPPDTRRTFDGATARTPLPVIGHETGQYQIYPDFSEIGKYTGVLAPTTLETMRAGLTRAGLIDMNRAFHEASGRLSMRLYKADIEMCLRTRRLAGFQLLDLQDYPGQGAALVGPLDAFMHDKGLISPQEWRGFCSSVVPLALFDRFTYTAGETATVDAAVANYSNQPVAGPLVWTLVADNRDGTPGATLDKGAIEGQAAPGTLANMGHISLDFSHIEQPTALTLTFKMGSNMNKWKLWVYPDVSSSPHGKSLGGAGGRATSHTAVREVHELTPRVVRDVEHGATVLLAPDHRELNDGNSVGGMFICDYWNYSMFRTISENNHRPVSPGTLGYLIDAGSSLFDLFPSDVASDMQWWSISHATRPLILDGTPGELRPEVWAIDNADRNHKLGVVFGARVGSGRVLVCLTDLEAVRGTPEGRQWRTALLTYAASDAFQPAWTATADELNTLLKRDASTAIGPGVENQSDYSRQE